MIFGDRIKQARELKGLTQTELAGTLKVTQPYLAQVEGGIRQPSSEFVTGLAFHLGFPPSFFEEQPTDDFPLGSLLFRAKSRISERQRREVYRWGQIAYDLYRRIIRGRNITAVQLHVPRCQESPAVAASLARSELGLGPETPIPNLINTLEKAGVFALVLPKELQGRDAFSLWAIGPTEQRRPVIVVVAKRPADRLRMSVAHELGHLVMHQPLALGVGNLEDAAKNFAGCFMLPEAAMRHDVHPPVTLETFMDLKVKWGVSIQALIVRSHELGIITQRKYKALFVKLSARGWRTREPLSLDVPLERPRGLRQIVELIYGHPTNYKQIAADARMHEGFVRQIIEAHAPKDRGLVNQQASPKDRQRPADVLRFRKARD